MSFWADKTLNYLFSCQVIIFHHRTKYFCMIECSGSYPWGAIPFDILRGQKDNISQSSTEFYFLCGHPQFFNFSTPTLYLLLGGPSRIFCSGGGGDPDPCFTFVTDPYPTFLKEKIILIPRI